MEFWSSYYDFDLQEFLTAFRDTIRPFNSPLMTPRRQSRIKPVRVAAVSLSFRYFQRVTFT